MNYHPPERWKGAGIIIIRTQSDDAQKAAMKWESFFLAEEGKFPYSNLSCSESRSGLCGND